MPALPESGQMNSYIPSIPRRQSPSGPVIFQADDPVLQEGAPVHPRDLPARILGHAPDDSALFQAGKNRAIRRRMRWTPDKKCRTKKMLAFMLIVANI